MGFVGAEAMRVATTVWLAAETGDSAGNYLFVVCLLSLKHSQLFYLSCLLSPGVWAALKSGPRGFPPPGPWSLPPKR